MLSYRRPTYRRFFRELKAVANRPSLLALFGNSLTSALFSSATRQYLKTTLTGMTASALDYSMLVVSGVDGVQRMTREHLAIALALQVIVIVVGGGVCRI